MSDANTQRASCPVNLTQKASLIEQQWSPRVVARK